MSFREMRLIVFYDLPTTSKVAVASHSKFRSFLIKNGFVMMQESIYVKHCLHHDAVKKVILRIENNKPQKGDLRCLAITEKQYQSIIFFQGEKSRSEKLQTNDSLVII